MSSVSTHIVSENVEGSSLVKEHTLVVERHPLRFTSALNAFERDTAVIAVDSSDNHTTTREVLLLY